VFFDLIEWRWTYEPVDVDGYIPDFLIHGPNAFYVEVGPVLTLAEFQAKAEKADRASTELGRDVLVVGISPIADLRLDSGHIAAGLLGEYGTYEGETTLDWAAAPWAWCRTCQRFAIYHGYQSYDHRPCGEAGHDRENPFAGAVQLEDLWAEAGNTVQWRP